MTTVDEQIRILGAGAVDLISEAELRRKLERGAPLRVKLGIDPTASDIHLGFAVVLRKLRQFQDLGHIAVLIIGDFTAQVGDPSGRSATRPRLTKERGRRATPRPTSSRSGAILDFSPDRLEVRRNSDVARRRWTWRTCCASPRAPPWPACSSATTSPSATRGGAPISLTEFLYPLLQGWDSVEVRADVELGGTDQLFNNLMGRQLQEQEGQEPQVVLTTPLLEGLDGVQKMSKSLGNYVGHRRAAGRAVRQAHVAARRRSCPGTSCSPPAGTPTGSTTWSAQLEAGRAGARWTAKRLLARTVVDLYHGDGAGAAAEAEFDQVFRPHEAPDRRPRARPRRRRVRSTAAIRLATVLRQAGLVPSNKEGRRMIEQGGGAPRRRGGRRIPTLTLAARRRSTAWSCRSASAGGRGSVAST